MSVVKLTTEEMRQFVQAGRSAVADLRATSAAYGSIGETIATATMQGGAGMAIHQAFSQNVVKINQLASATEEKLDGMDRFIQAQEEATAQGQSRALAVVSA
jgi:hypothetical protein